MLEWRGFDMMDILKRPFRTFVIPALAGVSSLIFVGVADAQSPTVGPSAAGSAKQALTATEQAAVAQMLNQVNALSGIPLQMEMKRLAKQYSDQNLNLTAIATAAKTAAGNKLGAVNVAFATACKDAPPGSAESVAVCAAAVAQPESVGPQAISVAALPDTAGIQTAAVGGAGGPAGGGLGGGAGAGGGAGNGNTVNGLFGTGGSQSYSAMSFSGRSRTSSVGTSVSTR